MYLTFQEKNSAPGDFCTFIMHSFTFFIIPYNVWYETIKESICALVFENVAVLFHNLLRTKYCLDSDYNMFKLYLLIIDVLSQQEFYCLKY